MRRHLLGELPLLMSFYPGLRPWDLYRFTRDELTVLLSAAREAADG